MATLIGHDSNSTRYSWLWVSHISPKNSKWLQENLTDMDVMVKAMIKLINEDADSFARRAEMYYKKRPELMKLVEEFYRAYRALAERYDQATGALRQAHRTISEEFPNQMPSMSEELPSTSQEVEPRTPEALTPLRAPLDPDDLHKDALGVSPKLFTVKRNGTHPDEISSLSSRKGLKQFNDLFASCDSAHRVSFSNGKVRKGLSFESADAKGKEDASDDIMKLQLEISKLLAESQSLKLQISSESQRANSAESGSQSLKDTISRLISEKDTALLQYSEATKRLSDLESELSEAHTELKKLSDYMAMEVEKLNCAESHNNTMESKLETLAEKIRVQEQELAQSRKEMESFHFSLQDESAKRKQAEDALCTIEKEYSHSQEDTNRLALEMGAANDRLSEFKQVKLNLEDTVCELKNEVVRLSEQNCFSELLIEELRGDIDSLVDSKSKYDSEIQALRSTISQMNTEKDVALLQHIQCIGEVSDMECKLSKVQSEREKIELKVQMLEQELEWKGEEAGAIHARLQDEHFNHMQKEAALLAMEDLHSQSLEEAKRLAQDLEHSIKKSNDLENDSFKLHDMLRGLKRMISELNSKKDAALLEQQKSLERVSCLEAQLLAAQSEMEKIVNTAHMLEQELVHKNKEVGNLRSSLQKEGQKCMLAETALLSVEHLHLQSQEEAKTLAQNLEILSKRLGEIENDRLDLQNISQELKNTISEMNSEKDAVLLQQRQSMERVSYLEAQLTEVQSELEKNKQKAQLLEQELKHKKEEVNGLQNNFEKEGHKRMHTEAELIRVQNLYSKSQEEVCKFAMDLKKLNNELSEVQDSKLSLEQISCELRNTISLLNTEKDATLLQQQLSVERVSDLKSEVSETQLELEKTEQKLQMLEQELAQKIGMVDFLQSSLQDEGKKLVEAETLLISNENLYFQSQETVYRLSLEIEMLNRKLNEVEDLSSELENTILLLNSEKDATLHQHKQSLVRTSDLESKLSAVQAELKSAEQKVQMLDEGLKQKRGEVDSLQTSLQDEAQKRTEGEAALLTMTKLHFHSQEEVNRLALEIDRLNRKLNEVENMSSELKNTILLLNSEKDTALLKHKQSLVRVYDLESKLSEVQAELENAKQKVKQKTEEVDTLQTSLKNEAQKNIEVEAALLAMTNLHSQSQEEVNRLVLKIERMNDKLNEMENSNMDLENMITKHAEDNHILGEQILSSELTIRGLHDELDMLKEIKANLENEVGLHVGEKEMLQRQLARQKKDQEILEKQYCSLEHEMEAVNRRAATLQQLLEKKVCDMEKLSEEYSILKKSFSNAIVKMEALKEIVKELEASESSLKYDASLHSSEKDALALELHILNKKYADISEKKSSLETSFSNVNSELGELRMKLTDLEELSESYLANNSALLAEKDNILSQLESTTLAMKSLEDERADMGDKHSSLLVEKDLLYSQLGNLQDHLVIKNEQHEALLKLHQIQINDFEETVSSLQEKISQMDQMLDQEQQESAYASISALILNNSLADLKDKNFALFDECQKLIEATHSAEVLIAQLEKEAKKEEEEKKALLKHNKKLRDGISQQIKILNICKDSGPPGVVHDEIMLQTLSHETFNHVKHKEESEHRNVVMDAERSVLGTILTQIAIDFRDLHLQKCELEKEAEAGAAELLFLRNKNHKLIELNDQLGQRLQQGSQREETLKIEVLDSYEEISGLRESYQNSQNEISNLTEKYKSLLKEYEVLVEKCNALDDENADVLAECMMLDHLSLFFSDHSNESASALASLNNDMATLGLVKHELDDEVKLLNRRAKILKVDCEHLENTLENLVEVLGTRLVLSEFDSNTSKIICQELAIELKSGMTQLMLKDDKLCKEDEKNQFLQEANQELCRVLRDLETSAKDAKGVKGELEKKITILIEQGAVRDNDFFLLRDANMALQGEVDIHKQKEENLMSTLEMVTKEAEQHEREIVSLVSDMITYSVNVMIYEEQLLELMMECEALEIRMITEREILMKEISSRDTYVDELHKRIASMGGENVELKAELSTYLPLVTSLSDQIRVLEEGTLLLSELNKEGKLEFVQEDRRGSESQDNPSGALQDNPSGALELQSLIARVKALRVVILDAKDRRDKEFTESAAKLEAANVEIQDLKIRKSSCTGRKEQYGEDDRQKNNVDSSKGKQVQIMKDIELDQVSTCSPYGTGATVYPLGGDANAELDDEMLQLWETAERDCKNQTAKSSSSEHDIEAVEEVKSEYPSFELARGRDLGIDRLEISTVSLEPQQLWSKNALEKLATNAQGLSIIQASIEEVKQKLEGTSKGKSPMSSEYSSIRAQLQEIEGSVLEQIDFNSNLTKKAEKYPAFEVNAELEGYSSRRKISEQVQKGSEKVARLDLELQKIQYVLLKLEEEHEYKRVKVPEKRSRLLLRDYMHGRKDKNDAGKKKNKVPFCGCMRPTTGTEP